jgi:DNA-binding NtrC family response regulator
MRLLSSDKESESRIAQTLQDRRAAGLAGEIPGDWMLDSPGLVHVLELARKLSRAPGAPILIEGERGCCLAELARLIHDADPSAQGKRFRTVTGQLASPPDMRGWAREGTLFIEDIENLRPAAQAWVKELLASRTAWAHPLRVIAGSHLSVDDLLRHPGLHEELVCELDVGRLVVPPLRERTGDILVLARRFLRHYADWQSRPLLRFSQAAERKLLAHTYPANVLELRNVVERAAALATSDDIGENAVVLFDQFEARRAIVEPFLPPISTLKHETPQVPTLAELERDYLVILIREFKGRRAQISRALGISYPTVSRMIAKHQLDVKSIVDSASAPIEAAG